MKVRVSCALRGSHIPVTLHANVMPCAVRLDKIDRMHAQRAVFMLCHQTLLLADVVLCVQG